MSMHRARQKVLGVSGGGGGGPAPTGNFVIGPDFGEGAGSDDNTFTVGVQPKLTNLALVGNTNAGVATKLSALGVVGNTSTGISTAMPSLAAVGNTGTGVNIGGSTVVTNMTATADMYVNEAAATTNFGSANPINAKLTIPLSNNEQRAFIVWDLTGFSGTLTSATVTFYSQTTALVSASVNVSVRTVASNPFNESTATWNTASVAHGVQRETISVTHPTSYGLQTLNLGAFTRANMLGNYLELYFIGADGTGLQSINIRSKEHGTASERPRLTMGITL